MVMRFCSVKLQLNYSVWKNKPKRPLVNTTEVPQSTGIPAITNRMQLIIPLTTHPFRIHLGDMVLD